MDEYSASLSLSCVYDTNLDFAAVWRGFFELFADLEEDLVCLERRLCAQFPHIVVYADDQRWFSR